MKSHTGCQLKDEDSAQVYDFGGPLADIRTRVGSMAS